METIRKGSPADIGALLATMHVEGEIVSLDGPDEGDDVDTEEENESIEVSDGPEDQDDLPPALLGPDDNIRTDDGVREALSFKEGSHCETCSDGSFMISFSNGKATFIPPCWVTNTSGIPTSSGARVQLFSLAWRLRFFETLAAWLTAHRPRFVSTFSLRYWAPDSVAGVEELYAGAGPNCLQQAMVKLLHQANHGLRLTTPTMSRYLGVPPSFLRMGPYAMPLADLFSRRAQTIWAATAVLCFMREHNLSLPSLDSAESAIAQGKIRPAASRVGNDARAMRLQDFILFVQKPLSRAVSVNAVAVEARRLLSEEPPHE